MTSDSAAALRVLRVGAVAPDERDGLPDDCQRHTAADVSAAIDLLADHAFDIVVVFDAGAIATLGAALVERGHSTPVLWQPSRSDTGARQPLHIVPAPRRSSEHEVNL